MALSAPIPVEINVAAGAAGEWYAAVPFDGEWKIEKAYFVPDADTPANGTDYTTLALDVGGTTIGSVDTSATGMTKGTPREISLSGGAALELTGGTDVVKITKTESGLGAAVQGRLVLGIERLYPAS